MAPSKAWFSQIDVNPETAGADVRAEIETQEASDFVAESVEIVQSTDAAGRPRMRALIHFLHTAYVALGALTADATGRARMAANFFGAGVAASLAHFQDAFWAASDTARAKFADGFFDTATGLAKFADGLFAANTASRNKFANGIWTWLKLAADVHGRFNGLGRVWTVGSDGGGAFTLDFASIPAALAVAAAGDLILVYPGSYAMSEVKLTKPVTIRALVPGTVTITDSAQVTSGHAALMIDNTAATAGDYVLEGLILEQTIAANQGRCFTLNEPAAGSTGSRLIFRDCTFLEAAGGGGAVAFRDAAASKWRLLVERCNIGTNKNQALWKLFWTSVLPDTCAIFRGCAGTGKIVLGDNVNAVPAGVKVLDSTFADALEINQDGAAAAGCYAYARGSNCTVGVGFEATSDVDLGRVFESGEETGTGGAQNVAHGLGCLPKRIEFRITDTTAGGAAIVEGAHDATNAVVTATLNAKYKVRAEA